MACFQGKFLISGNSIQKDIEALSKKERMPVAIECGLTDLPIFQKTVDGVPALDRSTLGSLSDPSLAYSKARQRIHTGVTYYRAVDNDLRFHLVLIQELVKGGEGIEPSANKESGQLSSRLPPPWNRKPKEGKKDSNPKNLLSRMLGVLRVAILYL
ncbi:peptidase [Striga asiatica]|uniref:Peptidase n=1 Tax=Striga asiatica TaxID=4170 RepID=A0A5A7PZ77_STRAF|nr:peptidase [Striga asiatica]